MKKRLLGVAALAALPALAHAGGDIDRLQNLAQTEFRLFSEDLGSALSYKALAPAEPLGITGFDVGLEVTATNMEHANLFNKASSDSGFSTLPVAKLHVHKGLPFNVDVGAFLSGAPDSNIRLMGAEIRYAFLEGGIATPAVAVRGTYTLLTGVDQLDLDTKGIELTISKGFAILTPYAGIGRVWTTSTPNLPAPFTLQEESFSQDKVYVGANLNFALMNLAVEADRTGDATSYGLKFGLRW